MTWLVIATSPEPGFWHWHAGHSPAAALEASDAGHIILMHRRVGRTLELVMQPAGPNWRAMVNRNKAVGFHAPTVRPVAKLVTKNRFAWGTP